ncbi:Soyasaponin III rhamnosyltransferase [Bertholletia excelsa]
MLPLWTDQGLNARAFDDKVGLEMRRDDEDGSFRREVVVETLKQVIVEEEGKTYRDKAEEMKAIFGDKEGQDKYLHSFAD